MSLVIFTKICLCCDAGAILLKKIAFAFFPRLTHPSMWYFTRRLSDLFEEFAVGVVSKLIRLAGNFVTFSIPVCIKHNTI